MTYHSDKQIEDKARELLHAVLYDERCTMHELYGCDNFDAGDPDRDCVVVHELSDFSRNDQDTTYHWSMAQSEWVTGQSEECEKRFKEENDLPENSSYGDWSDSVQETFSDYETEWFIPALIRLRVIQTGDEIELKAFVNYYGGPYYRHASDHQFGGTIELTLDQFMSLEPSRVALDTDTFRLKEEKEV